MYDDYIMERVQKHYDYLQSLGLNVVAIFAQGSMNYGLFINDESNPFTNSEYIKAEFKLSIKVFLVSLNESKAPAYIKFSIVLELTLITYVLETKSKKLSYGLLVIMSLTVISPTSLIKFKGIINPSLTIL